MSIEDRLAEVEDIFYGNERKASGASAASSSGQRGKAHKAARGDDPLRTTTTDGRPASAKQLAVLSHDLEPMFRQFDDVLQRIADPLERQKQLERERQQKKQKRQLERRRRQAEADAADAARNAQRVGVGCALCVCWGISCVGAEDVVFFGLEMRRFVEVFFLRVDSLLLSALSLLPPHTELCFFAARCRLACFSAFVRFFVFCLVAECVTVLRVPSGNVRTIPGNVASGRRRCNHVTESQKQNVVGSVLATPPPPVVW